MSTIDFECPRVPLLVIGCGNARTGDDAVGLHLVQLLAVAENRPAGSEFHLLPRITDELLDLFDRAEKIVFIDAIVGGTGAGDVVLSKLPSESVLLRHLDSISGKRGSLNELIETAHATGRHVPQLMLLGIEIDEALPGRPLSAPVANGMNYILGAFPELLEKLDRVRRRDTAEPMIIEPEERAVPAPR